MNTEDLRRILTERAAKCIRLAQPHLDSGEYFLAGSSISTPEINDIDIYPAGDKPFVIPSAHRIDTKSLNSVTVRNDPNPPLQFCRYQKPTLQALITSFDFSHVQTGAHIRDGQVINVQWTDSFVFAGAARTTKFEGSDYPLASAIRLLKYHKRGEMARQTAMVSMLEIVEAIVSRGFKDYDDFKDQLDAVDLGLVPEDVEAIEQAGLVRLFERLVHNGATK